MNVDEAIAAGKLRNYFKKKAEVFLPLNAQMKDVDLIVANQKNKRFVTIQVKGSRAFEPRKNEIKKFGSGSTGWFFIEKTA